MKLLRRQILQEFKEKHSDVRSQLDAWEAEVKKAQWTTPYDIKLRYPKASILKNQLVVFNIGGNRYRLLVQVSYKNGMIFIKNLGTHSEYNSWDLG